MTDHNTQHQILIAMGRICTQVAHDMRSPLTCIKTGIAILKDPTRTPEECATMLKTMEGCVERLNSMANELLAHRDADQVKRADIDLGTTIQSVCHQLRPLAEEQGVLLTCEVQQGMVIPIDYSKIWRVVDNLVQNALHAVVAQRQREPLMPLCRVSVRAQMEGEVAVIRVSDTGHGIATEDLERLFLEGFTTKGRAGNGLGLIYCAAVIEAHGGRITAINLPEGGAEFRVELDVVDVQKSGF